MTQSPIQLVIGMHCAQCFGQKICQTRFLYSKDVLCWGGCRFYATPCNQDFVPVPQLVGRAVLLNEVSCVDIGVINTGQRDRAIVMGDQRIAVAIISNRD